MLQFDLPLNLHQIIKPWVFLLSCNFNCSFFLNHVHIEKYVKRLLLLLFFFFGTIFNYFFFFFFLVPNLTNINVAIVDGTSIIRNFLWGQCKEERKMAWINWETLCAPKACGGMGFKQLKLLDSKDLGFYVFRTLICIVGKPWSKQCI